MLHPSVFSPTLFKVTGLIIFSLFLVACGGGSKSTPLLQDTIAPTIKLVGKNPITLGIGSNYIDAGATATDNIDGNITTRITTGGDSVNTNISGTYTITYNVEDLAHNSAIPKTRTVIVTRFSHVKMHYDLLKNQSFVWGEKEGAPVAITLSNYAAKGSKVLNVTSNTNLVKNQLITYHSTDGNYYIGKVNSLPNKQIKLTSPLEAPIAAGNNVWDLYTDSTPHPNAHGYNAIADFSIKSLGFSATTGGVHLLLGDSWFDDGNIAKRLKQKLPGATIINKGIGGNTAQDLLNRFDTDVTPNNPTYIWIICGTNDYWQGVTTAQYKANLKSLINKSKAIGAKVIIIDSSVGVGTGNTGVANKQQSKEYADIVPELY